MAFTKILPAGISTTGTVTLERLETTNSIVSLGSTNQLYINTDTPTVRPTLDLNFERDQRLDSRITFSRDSTATYLGSDGLIKTAQPNIPRFEFDTDGNCLGLLIEESRTNLITYSEDFNNVVWIKNVNLSSVPDSPNNTNSYLVIPTGSNTTYYLNYNTTTSNSAASLSIYAKAGGYDKLLLWSNQGGGYGFNLSTGQTFSVGNITDSLGASIESVGNGWYRCSITVSSFSRYNPYILNSETYETWTPDGTSGIYLWGAQLEVGSFPTSYIPTSGSAVTRSADFAKITGTNFTDFYNQTEGTIFFRYKNLSLDTSTIRGVWGLENSSAPVSGVRSPQSGSLRIRLLYNNNFSPAASNLFFISTDYQNGIVSYNQTENRLMMNGTSDFVSATHTNDNDIIAMSIGSRTTNGDSPLGGHISHLTYYPQRLSNAQLQNLTS